jgi:hypothetical protein
LHQRAQIQVAVDFLQGAKDPADAEIAHLIYLDGVTLGPGQGLLQVGKSCLELGLFDLNGPQVVQGQRITGVLLRMCS